MLGEATITVVEHTRSNALNPWTSKVVRRQYLHAVYYEQFTPDTINVYFDQWGNTLTMIEVDVAFHPYAQED